LNESGAPRVITFRRFGGWAALAGVLLAGAFWALHDEPAVAMSEGRAARPVLAVPAVPAVTHEAEHAKATEGGALQVVHQPADPHPHPINAERRRIQHELQLSSALSDAMAIKDVPRMRELLAEYRREHANDEHKLQEGYSLIADCIERPGEATRAAAQRYYDLERASTLRRFVRRACLEPAR
jgi:hypothetical protein